MAYKSIQGTRVGVHTKPKKKDITVPCIRCGRKRQPTHASAKPSGLCRDCISTMSEEEVAIWSNQSTEAA